MSQLPAFRELQNFIGEQTSPKPRRPKPQSSQVRPETANELTRRIVTHIRENGGFSTRLQSTGQYRDDLKKFVPSQMRAGMPDVLACVAGHFVAIEIKVGRDTLSEAQRQTIAALEQAGASVYVARDFIGFTDWFHTLTTSQP